MYACEDYNNFPSFVQSDKVPSFTSSNLAQRVANSMKVKKVKYSWAILYLVDSTLYNWTHASSILYNRTHGDS